ncbi:MAG: hypothetical protein KA714_22990 [Limnoraphis sp. WC205]|nr:hypothetical protein [Limnoraphis sp. WC205]
MWYLPTLSRELNPIENCWAELRKDASKRSRD